MTKSNSSQLISKRIFVHFSTAGEPEDEPPNEPEDKGPTEGKQQHRRYSLQGLQTNTFAKLKEIKYLFDDLSHRLQNNVIVSSIE